MYQKKGDKNMTITYNFTDEDKAVLAKIMECPCDTCSNTEDLPGFSTTPCGKICPERLRYQQWKDEVERRGLAQVVKDIQAVNNAKRLAKKAQDRADSMEDHFKKKYGFSTL